MVVFSVIRIFVFASAFIFYTSARETMTTPGGKSYFYQVSEVYNRQENRGAFLDHNKDIMQLTTLYDSFIYDLKFNPDRKKVQDHIDLFRSQNLINLNNGKNSTQCVSDLSQLMKNIVNRNGWALGFFDASGKPGPSVTEGWFTFVGNYDQCLGSSASSSQVNESFSGAYFDLQFSFTIPGRLGLCLPDSCSGYDIQSMVQSFLDYRDITSLSLTTVEKRGEGINTTPATVIAGILLTLIVTMAAIGTFYDIVYTSGLLNKNETKHLESKPLMSPTHDEGNSNYESINDPIKSSSRTIPKTTNEQQLTLLQKVFLAFSLYSNGKKLLDTKQSPGSLTSVHGVRFLSINWVILGHLYLFVAIKYGINYSSAYPSLMKRISFATVANAFISVDTFFTISGLLTGYIAIKEIKRKHLKINWALFYFHRFWRLTPPYMLTLLFVLGFQKYVGSGAMWSNTQPADRLHCEKNWWTNLLYVNNLVNVKEICFGHTWYLANDMQFFVISPIMLIPFYFHWTAGIGSCVIILLISWITTGALSYHNNWKVDILEYSSKEEKLDWFHHYYSVPWCRIGPYIVGIISGYILSVKATSSYRMPKWLVITGWIVTTASALAVVFGISGDIAGTRPSSRGARALYNAVGRSVWGACVSWVIIACSLGYGGPVNTLLSWSPFVALGRLTFMTYLVHLSVLKVFAGNMGYPWFINDTNASIMYLGFLVAINTVAFLSVLLLESPMIGLEKVLIPKKTKR